MENRIAAWQLAAALRAALEPISIGDQVPDSGSWREVLTSLEFWWPSVLDWHEESLDGFDFVDVIKSGPRSVQFAGLALLISDQVWTPCKGELQVDTAGRRIESFTLLLGQPGTDALGLDRTAKYGSTYAEVLRATVTTSLPETGWVFRSDRACQIDLEGMA